MMGLRTLSAGATVVAALALACAKRAPPVFYEELRAGPTAWAAGQEVTYRMLAGQGNAERITVVSAHDDRVAFDYDLLGPDDYLDSSSEVILTSSEILPADYVTGVRGTLSIRVPRATAAPLAGKLAVGARFLTDPRRPALKEQASKALNALSLIDNNPSTRPRRHITRTLTENDGSRFLLALAARRVLEKAGADPDVLREDQTVPAGTFRGTIPFEIILSVEGQGIREARGWAHPAVPVTGLVLLELDGTELRLEKAILPGTAGDKP